jgi:hypothetical protein
VTTNATRVLHLPCHPANCRQPFNSLPKHLSSIHSCHITVMTGPRCGQFLGRCRCHRSRAELAGLALSSCCLRAGIGSQHLRKLVRPELAARSHLEHLRNKAAAETQRVLIKKVRSIWYRKPAAPEARTSKVANLKLAARSHLKNLQSQCAATRQQGNYVNQTSSLAVESENPKHACETLAV